MITIRLNGETKTVEPASVSGWLESNGYSEAKVVVELNGGIVRRQDWDDTLLKDGDTVEIVGFVGGG